MVVMMEMASCRRREWVFLHGACFLSLTHDRHDELQLSLVAAAEIMSGQAQQPAKAWRALKALLQSWKTQDDEAKAAIIPRMEAMWKEAIGLLRAEVEQSAREAEGGVK